MDPEQSKKVRSMLEELEQNRKKTEEYMKKTEEYMKLHQQAFVDSGKMLRALQKEVASACGSAQHDTGVKRSMPGSSPLESEHKKPKQPGALGAVRGAVGNEDAKILLEEGATESEDTSLFVCRF